MIDPLPIEDLRRRIQSDPASFVFSGSLEGTGERFESLLAAVRRGR